MLYCATELCVAVIATLPNMPSPWYACAHNKHNAHQIPITLTDAYLQSCVSTDFTRKELNLQSYHSLSQGLPTNLKRLPCSVNTWDRAGILTFVVVFSLIFTLLLFSHTVFFFFSIEADVTRKQQQGKKKSKNQELHKTKAARIREAGVCCFRTCVNPYCMRRTYIFYQSALMRARSLDRKTRGCRVHAQMRRYAVEPYEGKKRFKFTVMRCKQHMNSSPQYVLN